VACSVTPGLQAGDGEKAEGRGQKPKTGYRDEDLQPKININIIVQPPY
jgi:hypothetical protein